VPHADNEQAGVFRARHNHLQVRYATVRDQAPPGFKRKMRGGQVTREFRKEVKETGVFFQTPKAAIATGNMPQKRLRILWEDEESSEDEMDADTAVESECQIVDADGTIIETKKEPKPEKDILDILMKADRKIYRHIKKKVALDTIYKYQEQQREMRRMHQKAQEEAQAQQQQFYAAVQARQMALGGGMPMAGMGGMHPGYQPYQQPNWADTHYQEIGEDPDDIAPSKRQRLW